MSADDKAFEAIKEKIKKMAKSIKDGAKTKLVDQPEVEVELGTERDELRCCQY